MEWSRPRNHQLKNNRYFQESLWTRARIKEKTQHNELLAHSCKSTVNHESCKNIYLHRMETKGHRYVSWDIVMWYSHVLYKCIMWYRYVSCVTDNWVRIIWGCSTGSWSEARRVSAAHSTSWGKSVYNCIIVVVNYHSSYCVMLNYEFKHLNYLLSNDR